MGVLASQGLTRIAVRRRPRLAVVATGDELVRPGEALAQGQIYASNSVAIAALIEDAGGVALDGGIARDDPDALIACLEAAARGADAVVTTGGVSVGEFDHVRGAFGRLGGAVNFWKIAIKPGKPFAWGHIVVDGRRVPLFGLPGNPVSAVVNFLQLARPWIRSSLGLPRPFLPVVVATAGEDLRARPGRAKLIRVTLSTGAGGWVAHSTGSQSSGVLSSIAAAHGLALVPAETAHIRAGEPVRVQVIDPGFLDGSDPGYGW
jgi:molybdopterin molybdotransferase